MVRDVSDCRVTKLACTLYVKGGLLGRMKPSISDQYIIVVNESFWTWAGHLCFPIFKVM